LSTKIISLVKLCKQSRTDQWYNIKLIKNWPMIHYQINQELTNDTPPNQSRTDHWYTIKSIKNRPMIHYQINQELTNETLSNQSRTDQWNTIKSIKNWPMINHQIKIWCMEVIIVHNFIVLHMISGNECKQKKQHRTKKKIKKEMCF
jgi:IS4 transposase